LPLTDISSETDTLSSFDEWRARDALFVVARGNKHTPAHARHGRGARRAKVQNRDRRGGVHLAQFDSHPAQRVAFVIPALRPLQHR
jgi:hypothetical protein